MGPQCLSISSVMWTWLPAPSRATFGINCLLRLPRQSIRSNTYLRRALFMLRSTHFQVCVTSATSGPLQFPPQSSILATLNVAEGAAVPISPFEPDFDESFGPCPDKLKEFVHGVADHCSVRY
jgi:hypothetical protein